MEPTKHPPPRRGIRRFFQFGLRTIIVITIVCAVALTWWRQRSLIAELEETREELRGAQHTLEYYWLVQRACRALDRGNPRHKKAFDYVEGCWLYGELFLARAESRSVGGGTSRESLEILLFQSPCIRHSGGGLGMIIREDENIGSVVVDVLEFTSYRLADEARFEDVDGDGIVELVIQQELGWDGHMSASQTRTYSISADGFRLRDPEPLPAPRIVVAPRLS